MSKLMYIKIKQPQAIKNQNKILALIIKGILKLKAHIDSFLLCSVSTRVTDGCLSLQQLAIIHKCGNSSFEATGFKLSHVAHFLESI